MMPVEKEKRKRKKNSKFEDSEEWNTDQKQQRRSNKKDKSLSSSEKSLNSSLNSLSLDGAGEIWLHEDCVVWSHGVYLTGSGKLQGLDEMLAEARQTVCSVCKNVGATLGCLSKGCNLKYHYLCAVEKVCLLDEENFSLVCPKHKDKKVKMTGPGSSKT